MNRLDVVNDMLGTMSEAPLNTLEDPHPFRGACLSALNTENRNIQAAGWWFNRERLVLQPMLNGKISLPGDVIEVRPNDPNVVQRGRYLYDTANGTDIFTASQTCIIIRLIPFDSLPESASQYIGHEAILKFQMFYDGDSARTQLITQKRNEGRAACKANETRNSKTNLIDSNTRLQQLKVSTRRARSLIRSQ